MRSLVLSLLIATASAQTNGTITGTVLDLPGQPVVNAPIQVTNTASKAVFKTTSSEKGGYTLAQLPAGTYELSVNAAGFNPFTQSGIAVAAGQTLRLDLHLFDFQLDTLGDGREFRVDQVTAHKTPEGPAPRTPDGKPDLTGVWYTQRTVDPGTPVPLPWADALQKERVAKNVASPGAHCLTRGILAAGALFPYETVLTPKRLVMIFEDDTPSHRTVYLDGRGHPENLDAKWMGHSIGRWEGDTLVVDTIGFNDETWLDNVGHPHTEMLHVIERLRRPDLGHLEIEYTVEDPGAYSKPWIIKRVADLDTKDEIAEYVCIERDQAHMQGK